MLYAGRHQCHAGDFSLTTVTDLDVAAPERVGVLSRDTGIAETQQIFSALLYSRRPHNDQVFATPAVLRVQEQERKAEEVVGVEMADENRVYVAGGDI